MIQDCFVDVVDVSLIWTCWIEGLDCVVRCCVGTRGASPLINHGRGNYGCHHCHCHLLLLLIIIISIIIISSSSSSGSSSIIIIIIQLANVRLQQCAAVGSEFSVLYCGCTKIAPGVGGVYHGNVSESTGLGGLQGQL